jgi:tetratricopeptide (TPR) repeat protein
MTGNYMRKNRQPLLFCFIILLLANLASADKIVLQSGRTLTGAILSETSTEYTIKTDVGTLRIGRRDVRNINREGTTAAEVDGDVAAASKNYEQALKNYQAALSASDNNSSARQRLLQKIAQVEKVAQHKMDAAVSREFQQASQLLQSGQYDPAIKILQSIQPYMGSDEATSAAKRLTAEAFYGKALAARDSQNEIEMEKNLREAIDAFEPFYRAHLLYGELLLRSSITEKQGLDEIARGMRYGQGELTEDERINYSYLVAKKYFEKGNYERAAANFAECLRARNSSGIYKDALDMAVKSYIKMGEQSVMSDFQKTIDNLTEALRLNPENKDAHFLLGRMYKDSGQMDKAIEEFSTVVKLDPNYENVEYYLAQAYRDKDDYENALKHFELELKNRPSNYDALVDRADVYIRMADYSKAEADLQSAIQIEPSKWRGYLLLAELALAQEQYQLAQDNLLKVLALKPDAVEAHVLMGKVLAANKQFDDAKKWFENVVSYLQKAHNLSFKYRNLMAEAQTALGEIDLNQESPRQAETRLREALEYSPNFARALNKIGDVKRKLGSESVDAAIQTDFFRQAEAYYEKAIESSPRHPDYYLSLAILYHKNLKDTQKAILNYRKYITLGGKDVVNVNKWIEECGGEPVDVGTTQSVSMNSGTTETSAFGIQTPGSATPTTATLPAAAVTSGTVSGAPETSSSLGLPPPATATAVTTGTK